jgi:hypothetical protein
VLCFNYNAKVEASKTAGEYILPVKKKQITDNKKADFKSLLSKLVTSGGTTHTLPGLSTKDKYLSLPIDRLSF